MKKNVQQEVYCLRGQPSYRETYQHTKEQWRKGDNGPLWPESWVLNRMIVFDDKPMRPTILAYKLKAGILLNLMESIYS